MMAREDITAELGTGSPVSVAVLSSSSPSATIVCSSVRMARCLLLSSCSKIKRFQDLSLCLTWGKERLIQRQWLSKPAMALVSVSHPQSLSGVSIAAMQDVTRMKLAFQEFYTSCSYPDLQRGKIPPVAAEHIHPTPETRVSSTHIYSMNSGK